MKSGVIAIHQTRSVVVKMLRSLLLSFFCAAAVAFQFHQTSYRTSALKLEMAKVDVLCRGIDHSSAIDERVQGKIGKVIDKLGQRVKTANMVLKVVKFPVERKHS